MQADLSWFFADRKVHCQLSFDFCLSQLSSKSYGVCLNLLLLSRQSSKLVITVNSYLFFVLSGRSVSSISSPCVVYKILLTLCFGCLCFRYFQPRGTEYEDVYRPVIVQRLLGKGKFSNMADVAKVSVNGCAEIENLLTYCEIPTERICVEEGKGPTSSKV